MKHLLETLLIGGALLALTFVVAGCNPGTDEAREAPPATTAPGPAATTTPPAGAAETTSPAAALGTAQAAGPFEVTVTTDPGAPKQGDTRLIAIVTRNGKPVDDAQVTTALSMPTMNMGGPTVELSHTESGRYEAKTNLSMGGAWQAKTTVSAGGDTGTATHDFTVSQ